MFKIFQNKSTFKWELWSLLAGQSVWPNGSLKSPVLLHFYSVNVNYWWTQWSSRDHFFPHMFSPSVSPHFSNLTKQNNRKQCCSLLAGLWVWPSGSLMTPVLYFTFSTTGGRNGRARWHRSPFTVFERSIHGNQHLSRARPVPMLAQPNTLPGPQVQFALRYRHRQIRAQETGFHVSRLK